MQEAAHQNVSEQHKTVVCGGTKCERGMDDEISRERHLCRLVVDAVREAPEHEEEDVALLLESLPDVGVRACTLELSITMLKAETNDFELELGPTATRRP